MPDRTRFSQFVDRLFAAAGQGSCEVVIEREAAAWAVVVELTGAASADGRHARVMATDITESRRTSQALHDREVRYRTLFERSRDALLTLSPPGWCFSSANRAAQVMFGADEAALALRTLPECSPPMQADGGDSAAAVGRHLDTAMREGSHTFDWTFLRGADGGFPAAVSLTRMDVDGMSVIHASIRDETEKRASLAHLAQADRLSSMGMLAASVAHEINNPLAYVLTNLELLATDLPALVAAIARCTSALHERVGEPTFARVIGTSLDGLGALQLGDVVDRATEALQGTRRICDVVKGLRTFSRVEQVERSRVDIERAVSSAIAMAQNEIRYRARLVTEFRSVPKVWASEGKLSQVLLNLLINAAHAFEDADPSGALITMKTWVDGDSVCIGVDDNGRGIAPDNLARVFEPFFTTKGVGKGSGLGLAICRELVAELGGALTVTSQVGVGSAFLVRLPAAAPARDSDAVRPEHAPPAAAVTRARVLVIDDEPSIRGALSRLLRGAHDVVAVGSGAEAKALITADPAFDVILCDVMMPGMTGMEFHAWLVGRDSALAARVVFVTGGAFTPKAADYLERVAAPRLDKPFDSATVRQVVADMIAAD